MIIVGAGGFAIEVLEIFHQNKQVDALAFYDDFTLDSPSFLFDKFPILIDQNQAIEHFNLYGNLFAIGVGNPLIREKMYVKFSNLGGEIVSVISRFADIGSYDITIGKGTNILSGAIISNSVEVGLANIIYYNSIITHDVITGNFVEISPGAKLLGKCKIGDFTTVGSNAVVLPNIIVGKNVKIGAGAVVTKDLPDNCVAVGVPAKIIK